MAFNLATFKTRSLTAVIFVIVMVAGVVLNQWSFFVLFSVIHFGCWVEYQKLVGLIDPNNTRTSLVHKFGVMLLGWCMMLYMAGAANLYHLILAYIGKWAGLALLVVLVIDAVVSRQNKKHLAYSFLGLIYISMTLALFISLVEAQEYMSWPLFVKGPAENFWLKYGWRLPAFLIACMWINDTMAYIVGSFIGKTPLSKISPKKTWEGTIGGIILCALVAGYLGWRLEDETFHAGLAWWCCLAFMAAVAGVLGDLLESKLKRMANVKDSGSIMPGHGGFLDRFDSLLLAAPVVAIILMFALNE